MNTNPFRASDGVSFNKTEVEIARIREREETRRQMHQEREQTKRETFKNRSEGYYVVRGLALIVVCIMATIAGLVKCENTDATARTEQMRLCPAASASFTRTPMDTTPR